MRRSNAWLFIDVHPSAGRTWRYPLPCFGGCYIPGATVIRGSEFEGYPLLRQPFTLDVVTVAAISQPPLQWSAESSQFRLDERSEAETLGKIRAIFHIALAHGNDSMVLSALGCGAFCNPPRHVAELFARVTLEFWGCFKAITFAIIDDHNTRKKHNPDGNFLPFFQVLNGLSNVPGVPPPASAPAPVPAIDVVKPPPVVVVAAAAAPAAAAVPPEPHPMPHVPELSSDAILSAAPASAISPSASPSTHLAPIPSPTDHTCPGI